jgi:tetratricopeptide (TPR) repeat protein
VGLAVLAGLSFFVAAGTRAQDRDTGTDEKPVELAMATPEKIDVDRCLKPQAPPSLIVTACTDVLDAGRLYGVDRARALSSRGAARQALGDAMAARSDLLEAAHQYGALISTTSPQPGLVYARALTWHALGEADRALADYNTAARADPTDPVIFLNRGILLARYKSDYKLALVDFDQVLALKPSDPQVLYRVGLERAAALAVTNFASR